jgi:hypothetical protein
MSIILNNPQFTELSVDTELVAVPGKQYYITNIDPAPITITYGGNTQELAPNQVGMYLYAQGIWNTLAPTVLTPEAALFTQLGDTPDNYTGQANKLVKVNSLATELEFIPKVETIYATDGVAITVPNNSDFVVLLDTSLGDASVPNFVGKFNGQKCTVISDGSGVATNEGGNGDYVNGVFVSPEATGLSYKKEWLNGGWKAVNEVTAVITILDTNQITSKGYMTTIGTENVTGSLTKIFDIPFSTVPVSSNTGLNTSNTSLIASFQIGSATQILLQNNAGSPISQYFKCEGYHA